MTEKKTAEEILNDEHKKFINKVGLSSIHTTLFPEAYKQQALNAMQEFATQSKEESQWISVKDRPLVFFEKQDGEDIWICTKDGYGEFMAAVELQDGQWWIKHCVLEDEVGLRIVGDDENYPCGYDISDISYYQIITPPKI